MRKPMYERHQLVVAERDRLVARLAEVEAAKNRAEAGQRFYMQFRARAQEAEGRLAEVEAERDRFRTALYGCMGEARDGLEATAGTDGDPSCAECKGTGSTPTGPVCVPEGCNCMWEPCEACGGTGLASRVSREADTA